MVGEVLFLNNTLKYPLIRISFYNSDPSDKDFYDDSTVSNLKFADVSAESKGLLASDIYKRRYLALKNLRVSITYP